jgi:hypothetical protein
MRSDLLLSLAAAVAVLTGGCRSYDYRIVQPAQHAQTIQKQVVTVKYDPLDYEFSRQHDHLAMRIINPTDERIALQGEHSYVVDPRGESHPLRAHVLGPHSFARLLLPPEPASGSVVGGYGAGFPGMAGPPYPFYGGLYNDLYFGPPVTYFQVNTPYDWQWSKGTVRLRLSYDRKGETFDHDFEFVREPSQQK